MESGQASESQLTSSLKEQTPLVSICIPAFNAQQWILECVNSALAQTYHSLEVLVVDDASTDNTAELVRSINDPRIRLVSNVQRLGMVGNWNKCLELAQAEFRLP